MCEPQICQLESSFKNQSILYQFRVRDPKTIVIYQCHFVYYSNTIRKAEKVLIVSNDFATLKLANFRTVILFLHMN